MNKIFISYSRKDESFARQLAMLLDQAGAEVWLDVQNIPAGVKWSNAIQQGLTAADLMLLIVSASSMASSNVADEWEYYHTKGKPIIPVLLEKVELPFQLHRLQWIDFTDPQSNFLMTYPKLLAELNKNGFTLRPAIGTAPYQIKSAPAPTSSTTPSTTPVSVKKETNWAKWGVIIAAIAILAALAVPFIERALNSSATPTAVPPTSTTIAAVPTDASTDAPQSPTDSPSATSATSVTLAPTTGSVVQSPAVASGSLDVIVAYSDADSLTIVVNGDSDFKGLALKSTTKTVVLPELFDALQFSSQATKGTCFRFVRSGQTPPLPRACDTQKTYVNDTASADVFWYDTITNRLANLLLMRGDQQIGLCSSAAASASGCKFQS